MRIGDFLGRRVVLGLALLLAVGVTGLLTEHGILSPRTAMETITLFLGAVFVLIAITLAQLLTMYWD